MHQQILKEESKDSFSFDFKNWSNYIGISTLCPVFILMPRCGPLFECYVSSARDQDMNVLVVVYGYKLAAPSFLVLVVR